jgi:hypothetical protein
MSNLNLYLLQQDVNTTYNSVNSMVVCASNELSAKNIHPTSWSEDDWAVVPTDVKVTLLGVAVPNQVEGIVLMSYNQH